MNILNYLSQLKSTGNRSVVCFLKTYYELVLTRPFVLIFFWLLRNVRACASLVGVFFDFTRWIINYIVFLAAITVLLEVLYSTALSIIRYNIIQNLMDIYYFNYTASYYLSIILRSAREPLPIPSLYLY